MINMKAVIQRVRSAKVTIDGEVSGEIGQGFLVLLGVSGTDTERECDYLAAKVLGLRVFEDQEEKMNLALQDVGGQVLVVSQFTLYGDCKKGNRPSFIGAARPERAIPLYERFVETVRRAGIETATGRFGADMLVALENDGPVTIIMDTDEIMPKKN